LFEIVSSPVSKFQEVLPFRLLITPAVILLALRLVTVTLSASIVPVRIWPPSITVVVSSRTGAVVVKLLSAVLIWVAVNKILYFPSAS
jgi:hypothetical protein